MKVKRLTFNFKKSKVAGNWHKVWRWFCVFRDLTEIESVIREYKQIQPWFVNSFEYYSGCDARFTLSLFLDSWFLPTKFHESHIRHSLAHISKSRNMSQAVPWAENVIIVNTPSLRPACFDLAFVWFTNAVFSSNTKSQKSKKTAFHLENNFLEYVIREMTKTSLVIREFTKNSPWFGIHNSSSRPC